MPESRARILLVTRNLPPLVGGMERLNWHIANELTRHADVQVIAPAGASSLRPPQTTLAEVPLHPLWRFLLASAWRAIRVAREWRPDIVVAGSGLTAPAAFMAARASGARAAVYLHGLDAALKHPLYRMFWHPAIRRMDTVIANSHPTAELARRLGVASRRLHIVHPGVEIPEVPRSALTLQAFRSRHGLGQSRLMLSVGRLTTRKGLREFVQHSLAAIVHEAPDILLVVVGDAPADSLHASVQTRESIQMTADAAGVGKHLRFLGMITDRDELACAYECAALHVFPVREIPGDPEGFGMVAIEAAAHGLPTVGFATGGIPDAVAEGVSGYLVPTGDYRMLASRINQVMAGGANTLKTSSRAFAERFAWEKFGERIHAALAPPLEYGPMPARQGRATLNPGSRAAKAKKIERLLGLAPGRRLCLLEVGTGAGGIAHYLGVHSMLEVEVDAVDVQDARQIFDGYCFTRVEGAELPFPAEHFDVVISKHVIEHVGDATEQARHLAELHRVLRPDGIGYLAVPNRRVLVEPHYRLAFLSWWPRRWRTPYLRLMGKGQEYDCEPLTAGETERQLEAAGFRFQQMHSQGLKAMLEIETASSSAWVRMLRHVPEGLFRMARRAFPTLIYRLEKS